MLANPRPCTRLFGSRTPALCPIHAVPYSLKPAPNLCNLPFYPTNPNKLKRFKKPLIIAELLLTAGGIQTPANEDAVSVSWRGVKYLKKKDSGIVVEGPGGRLSFVKEDGRWKVTNEE
jgi:hypothetical protein